LTADIAVNAVTTAETGGSGPPLDARRLPRRRPWYWQAIVQGTRYEVTVGEVEALCAYVAELAEPQEANAAERLLGQFAALAQHQDGSGDEELLGFTPVPAASGLAERAIEALRSEGHVRMGGRRWRLHRSRPSRASKRRFAPGRSPGDGAS
jgi:hypothetical protein